MSTGLLIVGHGSRNASANEEFERLVDSCRAAFPSMQVAHGYVELAEPSLPDAIAALAPSCDRVVVLPLFLFAAGHVKNDLPLALDKARRLFPKTDFVAAQSLGVHPEMVKVVSQRAESASSEHAISDKTAVLVVGRGSSDPDANSEFCKLVRLAGEGAGALWVVPCFIGITKPLVADALDMVARSRPDRIVVVPYFLFAGRLIQKVNELVAEFRERYSWIPVDVTPHLGLGSHLTATVEDRVAEAVSGARPLPCDNCQYRVPISGVAENVGGLKALLWSLRHSYTHTQAMPHEHAHAPLKKHVLVCGNVDCAERGSTALISTLRRLVKEAGRGRDIRVTRTHCMGRCGEGPTVAVYPDGVWYRGVRESDAQELVRSHLLGDRLVGELVDNIMQ